MGQGSNQGARGQNGAEEGSSQEVGKCVEATEAETSGGRRRRRDKRRKSTRSEIEKVLDHVEEENGSRQYKVRFIGYGPKSDLWYTDNEMIERAPGLVAEYEAEEETRVRKARGKHGARKGERQGKS